MIAFAGLSIFGKGLSIVPMTKKLKTGDLTHPKSVFLLGIFSGAATSCCAPVLAGAVTLAVISGAFWKALIVTFAYVFGMVFPLFLSAYFYDRFKLEKSKLIQGKIWELKIAGKNLFIHSTNLIAGIIFMIMGAVLIYLAKSGNTYWSPEWQVKIGESLNKFSSSALGGLMGVPNIIWGGLIFGIFAYFVYRARRNSSTKTNEDLFLPENQSKVSAKDGENKSCH